MITGFLVFLSNLLFSSEHNPLFIPIGLYFIKRHVWRVKIFHKTIHKTWNIFKHLEQLPENSVKNLVLRVLISQEESSIDQMYFSIDRIGIEQGSNHLVIFGLFSPSFRSIEKKLRSIENTEFLISLRNFKTWIFTLWNNILQIQISLLQSIHVHTYIYNRIPLNPKA